MTSPRSATLPAPANATLPLGELRVGTEAVVRSVHGEESDRQRLMEQGILPGARVRLVQAGNPCVCETRSLTLTMSRELSQSVLTSVGE